MKIKTFQRYRTSRSITNVALKKPIPTFLVLVRPDNYVDSLEKISPSSLKEEGVKYVILNFRLNSFSDDRVRKLKEFLWELKKRSIKTIMVSNRSKRRVNKMIDLLDIKVDKIIYKSRKPLITKRKRIKEAINNDASHSIWIANDFAVDTVSSNIMKIRAITLRKHLYSNHWAWKFIFEKQNQIIYFLLKKRNLLNEFDDFHSDGIYYDEFI